MARRARQSTDIPRARCGWRIVALGAFLCGWLLAGAAWLSGRTSPGPGKTIPTPAVKSVPRTRDGGALQQLCVIVRTMPSQRFALPALLLSLFSDDATRHAVRAAVIDTDGGDFGDLESIVSAINAMIGFEGVVASGRRQADVLALFPRLKTPDYGYLLTDAAIEDVIAAFLANSQGVPTRARRASPSLLPKMGGVRHVIPPLSDLADAGWTCELVMATNGDNVYAAEFIRTVHDALALQAPPTSRSPQTGALAGRAESTQAAGVSSPGSSGRGLGSSMVATHWYSHYRLSVADVSYKKMLRASRCGPLHTGRFAESVVSSVLRPGCVDLGAVALRTEVLAATGARFFADALRADPEGRRLLTSHEGCAGHPPAYCADGALFSRLAEGVSARGTDAGLAIVRAPLYFHQ